ncbi:MAG: ABC transporter substrate-binding protein [Thermodesulfobacteriota bacterium]
MFGRLVRLLLAAVLIPMLFLSGGRGRAEVITIAYFPGWPGVAQIGWATGLLEKEMGVAVYWRGFDTGRRITLAMAVGEVDIAYGLGSVPFTVAVSQGEPLKAVAVSESYGEAENLVVRDESGINAPRDLIGRRVAVPFGTTAHYQLLGILKMHEIEPSQVILVNLTADRLVGAFVQGEVDAACAWEPALFRMIQAGGRVIVPVKEQIEAGYETFGLVAVTEEFARKKPDLVAGFLRALDESTRIYLADKREACRLISAKAGLSPEKTEEIMATMEFYGRDEQLSPKWLGTPDRLGDLVGRIKRTAEFLASQKMITRALLDYKQFVDPAFW